MTFAINRASTWNAKPCDEAMRFSGQYVDTWVAKTLEEAGGARWSALFFALGTDHREISYRGKPHLARNIPTDYWVIEIPDLPALVSLQEKYGDLVLKESRYLDHPVQIEIYDDYRE